MVSRNLWSARLLGLRPPVGAGREPGLILIQIDGLSRTQFERAIAEKRLPFLARLIRRSHFDLETFYSGIPSTTPAVQGEIFFGVKTVVPSFQFFRRDSGREFRMFDAEAAEIVEEELMEGCPDPLLHDGHAYSNIFRGGAALTRYCSADLAPKMIFRRVNVLKGLVLGIIYLPKILRMLALALVEVALALLDAVKGLYDREDVVKELGFVPARVAVCVVGRELIRFRVLMDIERGVRVIHANFLGYDEQAHRRGPGSAFAHWSLKAIDGAIRDIYHSGHTNNFRDYEMIVYSDHGQEKSTPYATLHGRSLDVALQDIFSGGAFDGYPVWMRKMSDLLGNTKEQCRSMFGIKQKPQVSETIPDAANQIVVTAMGPLGHIYLPKGPDQQTMETYAWRLVGEAGIPLVLLPAPGETAIAFNGRGRWLLPADRVEVLGGRHPFLDEAAEDLVRLCHHRDAGDIIISGWDPQAPTVSFPLENGAHGGPGAEETRGFILVPDRIRRWHLSHLKKTRRRVRGEDLRQIALHYLGRDGLREERVACRDGEETRTSIKAMTYNIHSCVGLDGRVRPERVARVINQFDPDIVAVQEVDCHRSRSAGHDQSQLIADHLRMHHVFHALLEEQSERYGIAIFAKYPLEVIKAAHLTPAEPGKFREARGAIWVKIKPPCGEEIHFINTHFGLGADERQRQASVLLGPDWLGSLSAESPVIVCGDLNSPPGSKALNILESRFRDAQNELRNHKPRSTFTSVKPFRRIDHVFVSGHFRVDAVSVPRTATATIASDHLPVCVELSLVTADETI
jgi:endonuclease/exonuclease/phosphatase family metal-dependent hydrolase